MSSYIISKKSQNSNGGRPQKLGAMVFEEGIRGLFCGYDPNGNKAIIAPEDLEEILKNNYMEYKVEVKIVKQRESFSFARFVSKFLVPKVCKDMIKNEV